MVQDCNIEYRVGDFGNYIIINPYAELEQAYLIGYDDHDLLSSGKGGPNILQSRKGVMGDFIRDIVSLYRASLHPT